MSEIETHIGKLRKIGQVNDKYFEDKCKENGFKKEIYDDSWFDAWNSNCINKLGAVIKIKNEYYEIIKDESKYEEDIQYLEKNADGTFNYVMQFYNGGICLEEILEESLEKI